MLTRTKLSTVLATVKTAKPRTSQRKSESHEERMHQSISILRTEKAVLQEEVLQLRAAVHVYSAVVEALAARAEGPRTDFHLPSAA